MEPTKYVKPLKLACGRSTHEAFVKCPTGLIKITACLNGMHELVLEEPADQIDRLVGKRRIGIVWKMVKNYMEISTQIKQNYFKFH